MASQRNTRARTQAVPSEAPSTPLSDPQSLIPLNFQILENRVETAETQLEELRERNEDLMKLVDAMAIRLSQAELATAKIDTLEQKIKKLEENRGQTLEPSGGKSTSLKPAKPMPLDGDRVKGCEFLNSVKFYM